MNQERNSFKPTPKPPKTLIYSFRCHSREGGNPGSNYKIMVDSDIPKIIKDNCLDFDWDNKKVWEIEVPVEKMKMSELSWQFNFPFWHSKLQRYTVTPNQVFANPENFEAQYKRILDADLNYPIDIMQNKKGLWEILDGLHRLAKAYLLGLKEVDVRKIPESQIKNIIK